MRRSDSDIEDEELPKFRPELTKVPREKRKDSDNELFGSDIEELSLEEISPRDPPDVVFVKEKRGLPPSQRGGERVLPPFMLEGATKKSKPSKTGRPHETISREEKSEFRMSEQARRLEKTKKREKEAKKEAKKEEAKKLKEREEKWRGEYAKMSVELQDLKKRMEYSKEKLEKQEEQLAQERRDFKAEQDRILDMGAKQAAILHFLKRAALDAHEQAVDEKAPNVLEAARNHYIQFSMNPEEYIADYAKELQITDIISYGLYSKPISAILSQGMQK